MQQLALDRQLKFICHVSERAKALARYATEVRDQDIRVRLLEATETRNELPCEWKCCLLG